MRTKILTVALTLSAAAFMTGCSGAASAAPTATVTVTATPEQASATPFAEPSAPTPPPGAGVGGSVDPGAVAFEKARGVVISLAQGDKLSAIGSMTPRAAAKVKSENMKNYMFGGHNVKTCQVGKVPLTLKKPSPGENSTSFTTPDAEMGGDARVSAVEVVCDTMSFGLVVSTIGPEPLVDGLDYHMLPGTDYFLGT